MRRHFLLVCLLLACAAPAASAQEAPDAAPAAGAEYAAPGAETAPAAQPAAQSPSGLPQAAPPPRTLRAYWHVFIAFAVVWGLLFGYALMIGRRFGALERQVERLERTGA